MQHFHHPPSCAASPKVKEVCVDKTFLLAFSGHVLSSPGFSATKCVGVRDDENTFA